jgi:UDP-N-acetylglucosamine acyltransferase
MTAERIHPTAIVHPKAQVADNVTIGPYSLIGPDVKIGAGCKIHSHVVIEGVTTIGEENEFYQFCSIGAPPQDLTYKGEPTRTQIGKGNIFREYVSVHRGTTKEDEVTIVRDNCLLMAYVHLGHDVLIDSNCVFANSVNIAGHVKIGERVIIGGGTNISQFIKLGRGAYLGGGSGIDRDIPLFCTAYGNRVKLKGINIIGMRRQGYAKPIITEVVDFYRTMEASALSPRAFVEHDESMSEFKDNEVVQEMVEQIRKSEVGIAPFVS